MVWVSSVSGDLTWKWDSSGVCPTAATFSKVLSLPRSPHLQNEGCGNLCRGSNPTIVGQGPMPGGLGFVHTVLTPPRAWPCFPEEFSHAPQMCGHNGGRFCGGTVGSEADGHELTEPATQLFKAGNSVPFLRGRKLRPKLCHGQGVKSEGQGLGVRAPSPSAWRPQDAPHHTLQMASASPARLGGKDP